MNTNKLNINYIKGRLKHFLMLALPRPIALCLLFIKCNFGRGIKGGKLYIPPAGPPEIGPGEEIRGYNNWCEARKQLAPIHYKRQLKANPLFSIVVPVCDPKPEWLKDCINSVKSQTYANWELILFDDCSNMKYVAEILKQAKKSDFRIRSLKSDKRWGISKTSNKAIAKAYGAYIVFLDHDDILDPFALVAMAIAINASNGSGGIDIIYADEDFFYEDNQTFRSPCFKPEYSPDLLLSTNYMHHPVAVRRRLFSKLQGLRSCYDGSQDHDFLLRAVEVCEQVIHIPDVLYHMRVHAGSLASGPQAKPEAHERDRMLIRETLKRRGFSGTVEQSEFGHPGQNVIKREMPENISISVLIPTDGNHDLEGILGAWNNCQCLLGDPNLPLAEQANKMASEADGDILIIADSSLRPKTGWEKALVPHIVRHDIGLVTGKMTYHDGTLAGCGLVFDKNGKLGRWHHRWYPKQPGLNGWIALDHEISAVPWQFMGVRKNLFLERGGFNPEYQAVCFDVDFAFRLTTQTHLRHLAIAGAEAVFIEGYVATDYEAYPDDRSLFKKNWNGHIAQGDPFLNPNYSFEGEDVNLVGVPALDFRVRFS